MQMQMMKWQSSKSISVPKHRFALFSSFMVHFFLDKCKSTGEKKRTEIVRTSLTIFTSNPPLLNQILLSLLLIALVLG